MGLGHEGTLLQLIPNLTCYGVAQGIQPSFPMANNTQPFPIYCQLHTKHKVSTQAHHHSCLERYAGILIYT